MTENLLKVENLKTWFFVSDGIIKAVDGVSFEVKVGEVVGIVGESGSGKSVTALSLMRLVPDPPGKIIDGRVLLKGIDILQVSEREMRKIRGAHISMSFQDPMTFLNPVMKVGDQIAETIVVHQELDKKEAFQKAIEMMKIVQIPDAEKRVHDYPHQLSGGMRQRILLAIALSCEPSLLIADEPTTALDVIVQAGILDMLRSLRKRFNLSILIISHDMGVIAQLAERVAIMYAGRIVEVGEINTIFNSPMHPYTFGLLESLPKIDEEIGTLFSIPGDVPDMLDPPVGCHFHPRCPHATPLCKKDVPQLEQFEEGHLVACIRAESIRGELRLKK